MTKVSKISRNTRQTQVIRIVKPKAFVNKLQESIDSPIRSSVDSWLSSVPSKKQRTVLQQPKKVTIKPSNIESIPDKQFYTTRCLIISLVLLAILFVGGVIGIILAVKLQPTSELSNTNTPNSN
ncbi:hypothetical protein I4U23_008838 [Adineta vaga]|nr:hypothetical protein I4U23_008838 [Adineta vaga]